MNKTIEQFEVANCDIWKRHKINNTIVKINSSTGTYMPKLTEQGDFAGYFAILCALFPSLFFQAFFFKHSMAVALVRTTNKGTWLLYIFFTIQYSRSVKSTNIMVCQKGEKLHFLNLASKCWTGTKFVLFY